ncbi:glutamate binding protein [Armillaria solidipes]|uniref:Glutamate binding protein n=1 Tax=Armillaria solidipes TaxID=1076256 RepID=A0A2H3CE92_9AGAR|nr:glutamate binding protein [Armillaria solidipes]
MSQYPVPPPSYGATPKANHSNDPRGPLVGSSSGGAFYDQPEAGDLPDDFKYGVNVAESAPEIRRAFVRKVYTILLCQILATCIVSGAMSRSPSTIGWVVSHSWSFYVPLFGTLVNLGFLYWKRHDHPLNLLLLSTFTVLEAFTLGVVVAFYRTDIVIQALLITLGVFIGLTLFTFQSKYDFEGMGPFLFGGLIALCMTGFVGIFIPFGRTMDLIYAIFGCLLFSGYVVYDTYMINAKLSPDEYIMGSISLYLDFINLFLNILRLLNNAQER